MAFDVAIRFSVAGADQAEKALAGIGDAATASANKVEPAHRRIRDGVESISAQLDRLQKGFQFIAGLSFAGLGLRELAELTDTFKNLNARMELSTGSASAARAAFHDLLSLANGLQMPLEETATLFNRLSPALKGLGASQEQVIALTQVLGATLKTSGATTAEASSFMLQFSQAMAAGALRGEEFNSVSEANPRLMRALADGLGVAQGKLKQMASDGKLTAESVFNALSKQAETLNGEASKMPATFSGMLTQMKNNTLAQIGELDQKLGGVSDSILKAFNTLLGYKGAIIDLFITGAKVAAAYFALFVAAPAVISAVGTAMLALRTAMLQYQLAAAISGSYTTALSAAFGGATTASFTLTGAVTKLQLAFGVLFAAFAGWEIGTWLRENFVEANLAGIAFVAGTLKGWEAIKYGAQVAWAYIGAAWRSSIEGMGSVFAWFLDKIAAGLGAMGLSSASKQMTEWANSTRDATKNSQSLDDELKNLKEGYDAATGQITRITDEMADEAIAHFKVTDAADKNQVAMGKLGGSKRELSKDQKALLDALKKELDKLKEQNATYGLGEDAVLAYRAAKEGLTPQSAKIREAIAAERAGLEAKKAATEAEKEAIEAVYKARQQEAQQAVKRAEDLADQVKKQEEENLKLSMTTAQYRELEMARLREQLRLAELAVQEDEYLLLCNAETEAHKDTVAALKKLIEAKEQGIHLQAAKEANEAWQKTVDSIGQGLTDSLYRAFEAGKGFFETLWSGIKNTFKTTVLKMVVQTVMSPVNAVLGSMMGAGNAMAGTGAAGGVGGLSNLVSMGSKAWDWGKGLFDGSTDIFGSSAGGWMTDFGGSVGTATSKLGGWLFDNGAEGLGNWLGSNQGIISDVAGVAGDAFGYFGALKNAANGKWGSAIGSGVGTFFGGPIGGAIGNFLGGAIDSLFGGDGKDYYGADYMRSSKAAAGYRPQEYEVGDRQYGWSVTGARSDKLESALKNVTDASIGAIANLQQAFGNTSDFKLGTYFSNNGDVSQGNIKLIRDGQTLATKSSGSYGADGEAGFKAYAQDVASSVRTALDSMGLPDWAKNMLNSIGNAPTLETVVAAATQIAVLQRAVKALPEAMNPLGGIFSSIATASESARLNLVQLAGGIENLASMSKQFVADYYTKDEQAGLQAKSFTEALKALGLDGSQLGSREDFRALVESLGSKIEDATAQKQLVGLLALGPQFATLADYLKENGKTLADATAAAPQVVALTALTEQQQAGQDAQISATETLNSSVIGIGNQISAGIDRLGQTLADRLAAVESAVNSNARYIGDRFLEAQP